MNSELALRPLLLENVQQTRRELGRGAYGVVLEVKVNGTICAAKKLHDLIVQVDFLSVSTVSLFYYCNRKPHCKSSLERFFFTVSKGTLTLSS